MSVSSGPIRCTERTCSRFATRLRWVSITPLESPVVPDEKGSTARSAAGSTAAAGGAPSPVGSASSAITRSIPATAPRSGSATITARAPASPSCLRISSGVSSGLIDVTIAPSAITAWKATGQSTEFGASSPTASPCRIPSSASPAATARTRSASSA